MFFRQMEYPFVGLVLAILDLLVPAVNFPKPQRGQ